MNYYSAVISFQALRRDQFSNFQGEILTLKKMYAEFQFV